MNIVVTGKGGQLASEIELIKGNNPRWTFYSVEELDITNIKSVKKKFQHKSVDFIINCAAYTNVDGAEDEKEKAFSVNELGIKNLIKLSEEKNSKLIHVSTDYVFDGNSKTPYKENDITNPHGVYGKSKLAGEIAIIESSIKSVIIRTSWLYSNFGNNFVKTMLRIGKERTSVAVVGDQIGSPTNAEDLSKMIIDIINNKDYEWVVGDIFHYSNEGFCSWFDFSNEIFSYKKINIEVKKLFTHEFKTKTMRPKYSLLDKSKIKSTFGVKINDWKFSLRQMLNREII